MPYVGKEPVRGQNRELDDISGSFNGGNTAFTMQVGGSTTAAASANQVFISLGGVMQNPGTDFTVASSTITFTTPPANGLSFWGLIQGDAVDIQEPADGSVTAAKLASGAGITVLTGSTNNTITTVTGAGAIQGEANLTFDGDLLSLNKRAVVGNGTDAQIPSRVNTSSYTPQLQVTGAWNDPTHGGTLALNGTSDYPNLWINSGATYQDNAGAGVIHFSIKDGAGNYCNTASIQSQIDGTPGNNDSPGELSFWTTPDGTCNPTMKMKVHSNGNVEVNDGDLIIGTAGHGIDFSATGDATGTGASDSSELFSDYETGTWTPTSRDGTLSYARANYTKIGRMVHLSAYVDNFSDTSTNDSLTIQGIPFPQTVGDMAVGSVMYANVSDSTKLTVYLVDSRNGFNFYGGSTGGYDQVRYNELSSSHSFYFQATYFA